MKKTKQKRESRVPSSGYSWKTSLPAYLSNKSGKDMQGQVVLYILRKMPGKRGSIAEVRDFLRSNFNVVLPQSTISGRIGDLRQKGKVADFGDTKMYKDRLRKVFYVVTNSNRHKVKTGKKIRYEKVVPVFMDSVARFRKGILIRNITLKLSDGTIWNGIGYIGNQVTKWNKKRIQRKRKEFGRSLKSKTKTVKKRK